MAKSNGNETWKNQPNQDKEIELTTYDRLLRAWENSVELVRDYEMYSKRIEDDEEVKGLFKQFAEDEGLHAAALKEKLLTMKHYKM